MQQSRGGQRELGVAVVGLGGAVASTAVAGMELMKAGLVGTEGLPLADASVRTGDGEAEPLKGTGDLVPYENLVFGGWDLSDDDLATAAEKAGVLDYRQLEGIRDRLAAVRPWPAASDSEFCRNAAGTNVVAADGHRAKVEAIRADLRSFKERNALDSVVLVNLASTERVADLSAPTLSTIDAFESGLDEDAPEIGPAMLYAYAAISEGSPYVNFAPSAAADAPALKRLAEIRNVPVSGKDGKTGQTMLKTVLAPALRSRALHVEGWYSTNLLGNGDGHILDDPGSLASKSTTKGSVLDDLLGYEVQNHIVSIHYYPPRGDNKEAWDNVDVTGFLGKQMQLKVNFLCGDSVLAAPLVIELSRLSDLARRRGSGGVQEQFGHFFKAPMTVRDGDAPDHDFHRQERRLFDWISNGAASVGRVDSASA